MRPLILKILVKSSLMVLQGAYLQHTICIMASCHGPGTPFAQIRQTVRGGFVSDATLFQLKANRPQHEANCNINVLIW